MNKTSLDRACFAICVVCIVVAVVLALTMIWVPTLNDSLWKGLATVGVVFVGSSTVLSLSRTFDGKGRPTDGPHGGA